MSLPFSPYLSQILTKLLENLTGLQGIKISIHLCNLREVILVLFGTINFTTKNRSQPVWTGFFRVVDRLGLVFKGPVAGGHLGPENFGSSSIRRNDQPPQINTR